MQLAIDSAFLYKLINNSMSQIIVLKKVFGGHTNRECLFAVPSPLTYS